MKPRVILIEDDSELRESLLEYLKLAHLDVTGVANAIEFYQTLNISTFDAAIVDIGLPDQSGYEVTQYLRDNTAMGIIILTAKGSIEDRIRGYNAGADLFFVKPVDCQELVAAIRNLVKRLAESCKAELPTLAGEWLLDKACWTLTSPEGAQYKLTGKELLFMDRLVAGSGEAITREELMEALEYDSNKEQNRALDALVRRLRRRFEENREHSDPIRTVHSVGYCFAAPVKVTQSRLKQEAILE